jgi:hypothetical protein
MRLLAALAVTATTVFGPATAEVVGGDADVVEVKLTVEAEEAGQVVAHVIDAGGDQETIAMREAGRGVYTTRLETRPIDLVVVFESLTDGARSAPARLTDLGVNPADLGAAPVPAEPEERRPWGWLALGLAAAALAVGSLLLLGRTETEVTAD